VTCSYECPNLRNFIFCQATITVSFYFNTALPVSKLSACVWNKLSNLRTTVPRQHDAFQRSSQEMLAEKEHSTDATNDLSQNDAHNRHISELHIGTLTTYLVHWHRSINRQTANHEQFLLKPARSYFIAIKKSWQISDNLMSYDNINLQTAVLT